MLGKTAQLKHQLEVLLQIIGCHYFHHTWDWGFPLCYISASFRYLAIFKLIIKNIENKNPTDKIGWTPFHEAARNGHWKICKVIIDNVRNINPVDNYGRTPLDVAKWKQHFKVCTLIRLHQ